MPVESCNPEDIQLYHRVQVDQQKRMANGSRFSRSLVTFILALVIPEDCQPLNIVSAPFCEVR